jgi:hypothetical protein
MYMKRGQAAIEFLSNYGWMFLILVIVLGGLGYLGVFQPGNFISDSCSFSTSIACGPFSLYEDEVDPVIVFDLEVNNNLPQDIRIDAVELRLRDSDAFCRSFVISAVDGSPYSDDDRIVRSRGLKEYRFAIGDGISGCSFANAGLDIIGKHSYDVRIEYVLAKEDTQLPLIIPGKLVTEISRP